MAIEVWINNLKSPCYEAEADMKKAQRLADVKSWTESTELRQRFADVVTAEIAKGISEGLKHGVDHGRATVGIGCLEGTSLESDTKCDHASLHLESELECFRLTPIRPLKIYHPARLDGIELRVEIPGVPVVQRPKDPWAVKEEMLLEDAIAGVRTAGCCPQTEVEALGFLLPYLLWFLKESLCVPNVLSKQFKDTESVAAGVATRLRDKQLLGYLSYRRPEIITV
ncbi:hypothetical protein Tco_0574340 [Tanacetum coccineum]